MFSPGDGEWCVVEEGEVGTGEDGRKVDLFFVDERMVRKKEAKVLVLESELQDRVRQPVLETQIV